MLTLRKLSGTLYFKYLIYGSNIEYIYMTHFCALLDTFLKVSEKIYEGFYEG